MFWKFKLDKSNATKCRFHMCFLLCQRNHCCKSIFVSILTKARYVSLHMSWFLLEGSRLFSEQSVVMQRLPSRAREVGGRFLLSSLSLKNFVNFSPFHFLFRLVLCYYVSVTIYFCLMAKSAITRETLESTLDQKLKLLNVKINSVIESINFRKANLVR